MNEHRIYEKKHAINTKNTQSFYDDRARRAEEMNNPYVAVLLGDQNPKHAIDWDVFEKKHILEQLRIDHNSSVLDIGCGIGRWAESVIPLAGYYMGVDFSTEMIRTARKRCEFSDSHYEFLNASFQEVAAMRPETLGHRFNRVIIGGVCMYINDEDMGACLNGLNELLDEHCVMYLTETVAVEKRLTLDECPSEALKTTYDVIYRTPAEYNQYYEVLLRAGFQIVKQDYLPHLNDEKGFSETDRWYTIFER